MRFLNSYVNDLHLNRQTYTQLILYSRLHIVYVAGHIKVMNNKLLFKFTYFQSNRITAFVCNEIFSNNISNINKIRFLCEVYE